MLSSSEGSQSTSLYDSNKPIEQCEQSIDHLHFAILYWWRIPSILFLRYLFVNTYKATPHHLGLQSALIDHRLVLFASHNYQLKFFNSGLARIWTWISGTKSGCATIVLCSVDHIFPSNNLAKLTLRFCSSIWVIFFPIFN